MTKAQEALARDLEQVRRSFEQIGVGMQQAINDLGAVLNRMASEVNAALAQARQQRPPSLFDRLPGYPGGGMPTGTCSDPRHASQHPPHITKAAGQTFWCVGGFVRADGTTPTPTQERP